MDTGCTAKTLLVHSYTTTEEVCSLCASKFKLSEPERYALFLVTEDTCQQLAPDTHPQQIKAELHRRPRAKTFHFVYRRVPHLNLCIPASIIDVRVEQWGNISSNGRYLYATSHWYSTSVLVLKQDWLMMRFNGSAMWDVGLRECGMSHNGPLNMYCGNIVFVASCLQRYCTWKRKFGGLRCRRKLVVFCLILNIWICRLSEKAAMTYDKSLLCI